MRHDRRDIWPMTVLLGMAVIAAIVVGCVCTRPHTDKAIHDVTAPSAEADYPPLLSWSPDDTPYIEVIECGDEYDVWIMAGGLCTGLRVDVGCYPILDAAMIAAGQTASGGAWLFEWGGP